MTCSIYSLILPPPKETRYFSTLSQSSFVRQKMMAWSILCSLIAVTRYSTLRILTASDRDSDNEREMNKHKKVNRMRPLNLFLQCSTWVRNMCYGPATTTLFCLVTVHDKISLRRRRLEVVGRRKNGRAMRHARGEVAHPSRVSLARARSLFRPLLPSAWYPGYDKTVKCTGFWREDYCVSSTPHQTTVVREVLLGNFFQNQ